MPQGFDAPRILVQHKRAEVVRDEVRDRRAACRSDRVGIPQSFQPVRGTQADDNQREVVDGAVRGIG